MAGGKEIKIGEDIWDIEFGQDVSDVKTLKALRDTGVVNVSIETEDKSSTHTYSKVFELEVRVWDEDYRRPLHRTDRYICVMKCDEQGKYTECKKVYPISI
jgi:hypothetical protein